MVNKKMVNIMKRHYIQPAIHLHQISMVATICVGSVHGNAGLTFSGGSDGSDEAEKPF